MTKLQLPFVGEASAPNQRLPLAAENGGVVFTTPWELRDLISSASKREKPAKNQVKLRSMKKKTKDFLAKKVRMINHRTASGERNLPPPKKKTKSLRYYPPENGGWEKKRPSFFALLSFREVSKPHHREKQK